MKVDLDDPQIIPKTSNNSKTLSSDVEYLRETFCSHFGPEVSKYFFIKWGFADLVQKRPPEKTKTFRGTFD